MPDANEMHRSLIILPRVAIFTRLSALPRIITLIIKKRHSRAIVRNEANFAPLRTGGAWWGRGRGPVTHIRSVTDPATNVPRERDTPQSGQCNLFLSGEHIVADIDNRLPALPSSFLSGKLPERNVLHAVCLPIQGS